MKIFLISLGAGILVGAVYWLLGVRSPAPPAVALVGLLGILIGEQAVPVGKRLLSGRPVLAYVRSQAADHVLGYRTHKPKLPEQGS